MPVTAVIYRIFIACPSDLREARRVVTDAIEQWNAQHSESEGVVLVPVMWDTHSKPQWGTRPQEPINRLARLCDILVAMFWTKIGTKTGVAESGTLEEIQEFVSAGKPALVYFSSNPIDPTKIDLRQLRKLQNFKDSIIDEQKALVGSFGGDDQLRQTLLRDLLLQVRELKAATL